MGHRDTEELNLIFDVRHFDKLRPVFDFRFGQSRTLPAIAGMNARMCEGVNGRRYIGRRYKGNLSPFQGLK